MCKEAAFVWCFHKSAINEAVEFCTYKMHWKKNILHQNQLCATLKINCNHIERRRECKKIANDTIAEFENKAIEGIAHFMHKFSKAAWIAGNTVERHKCI